MKDQIKSYTICFYSDAHAFGGAEKYLMYLADGLNARGRTCHFITNIANTAFNNAIDIKFNKSHLDIKSNRYYEVRHYIQLFRILKKIKPDIFHYNLPSPYSCSIMSPIVAKLAGVKTVVTTEHLPMLQWWPKPALLKKISLAFVDCAITVSHANKGYLITKHHLAEKMIKVVPNGIDVTFFSPEKHIEARIALRKRYNYADSDLIFGVVGRLEEQKGHIFALRAMANIQQDHPAIKLIFFGDGNLAGSLLNEAINLKIDHKVTFAGVQTEMAPAYSCIDVLLMPSLFEGLPLALLEAMAMEKPAIATAVNGIPEVIEHELNGILVPPQDTLALAKAMSRLASEMDKNYLATWGQKARGTVSAHYSLDVMTEKTDTILGELNG